LVFIRDLTGLAENATEARKIVKSRMIYVDGSVVTDARRPLGLMDIISIPQANEHYRMLIYPGKRLRPVKIQPDEARFKLGQVKRKMHVGGGHLQFTLSDGRNLRFRDITDEVRSYRTLDTFKISLPDQRLEAVLRFKEGVYGYIHGGSKSGLHGRVVSMRREVVFPDKPTVTLELPLGGEVTTLLPNVMPVGDDKPWILLP